jgi:hypothetical protein
MHQYYGGKWGSSVQSLTLRNPYSVTTSTVVSFHLMSHLVSGEGYLQCQISKNNGDSWQTLGTFNGRIDGWVNLMTKEHIWTPFGWAIAGKEFDDYDLIELGDDIIFWSVVKYGFVPVFVGTIVFLLFLYKLHWFVCQLPRDSNERKIANICLATSIGIISGGMSNAAQLYVFPVNVYFYFCLSFVFSIYLNYRTELKQAKLLRHNSLLNLPDAVITAVR